MRVQRSRPLHSQAPTTMLTAPLHRQVMFIAPKTPMPAPKQRQMLRLLSPSSRNRATLSSQEMLVQSELPR